MKNITKKLTAVLAAVSMTMTALVIPITAASSALLQITFDAASDTAYTVQENASFAAGRAENALDCTGNAGSYAVIDDVSAINSMGGDFTFSVWCYPRSDKEWTRLYDIGNGTGQYIFLAPSSSFATGHPRFVMKNGGAEQTLTASAALDIGEWNNITVTRTGALTTIYVNGLEAGSSSEITLNPSDIGATANNYLGKSQYDVDPYFYGMIDDFAVYDTALSSEEVRILAAEAYDRTILADAAKYDRYQISTDFYNDKQEKIFNAQAGQNVTARVSVKNSRLFSGAFSAVLTAYTADGSSIAAQTQTPVTVNPAQTEKISLSAVIPDNCTYLNVLLTDNTSGQEYDGGYLSISDTVFPPASPQDTDSTTFGAHDPTIFKDPAPGGHYWAYSTHNLIFESADLINWTKHDYTKTLTVPEKAKTFINANYSGTTVNTTYWAPDILYVPGDAYPYWFYASVSCGLGGRNSVITLLKCKSPGIFDGDYLDCGVVLASKESNDYITNAIDSNIYTDTDGKNYFIWGSFWGGIHGAPLNADGTVSGIDYSSDAAILSSSKNFGKTLFTVPNGVFGPEGPFMISNSDTDYRYLFTSYGWLGTNYNIRLARSPLGTSMENVLKSKPEEQFIDQNGNKVGTAYRGQSDKSRLWGYKLIGSYQLGDGLIYYGNGHNSVLQDEDGSWYLIDHSKKTPDAAGNLQVRKMLWTDDGWPVVSPVVYAGEQLQPIDPVMLYGTWDLSSVGQTIFADGVNNVGSCSSKDADLPVLSSEITLMPDGELGDQLGTWSFDGDHTVTIQFAKNGDASQHAFYQNGDIMKLYVLTGYDKDKRENALVMTGTDQNHITQFAKKANACAADTQPVPPKTTPVSLEKSIGGNPVLGFDANNALMYAGDPAATVIGDTVYLYAGHDTSNNNADYRIPEWVLYTSKNMTDWTYEGAVLKAADISWASDSYSAWASQMIEHNGKYYLYFCTWDKTDGGKQSIGVAVADSPKGPFRDIGHPLIQGSVTTPQSSDWNDIDPTVFVETVDGVERRYLGWGNGKYYICELNEDMISVKDQNDDGIIDMHDIQRQKFPNLGSDTYTEAPWLYKRGDTYYTFFAANFRETMAYATADSPYGPWLYRGQIMPVTATSNTNHPSVIDFQGKTYFIYHNGALPGGSGYRRSICVQELFFDENGNVLPLTETSTGLNGTASSIITKDGRYIAHTEFDNPGTDAGYPISKPVVTTEQEDGLNTAWEIIKSQDYAIQSVDGQTIGVYACDTDAAVYAVKYQDGMLTHVQSFPIKTLGDSVFTADFEPDAVFIWDSMQNPCDRWTAGTKMTEQYVSLQSVNKPGLFLAEQDYSLVLTQNTDNTLSKQMRFRTVNALDGTEGGVSFESVSKPGRYLTAYNGQLLLTYGSAPSDCTFTIGGVSQQPVPTARPVPTPTPVPSLTPDISNNFDSLPSGVLLSLQKVDQEPYTGVEGLILYMGTRSGGGENSTSIAVETGGVTGNAIALNCGKFVDSSRGGRLRAVTPTIIDNSTAVMTVKVKLINGKGGNAVLRWNDSDSSEKGTELTGLNAGEWTEIKVVLQNTDGDILRTIYVNDIPAGEPDSGESFPVFWGTMVNETYSKLLFDDLSIITTTP